MAIRTFRNSRMCNSMVNSEYSPNKIVHHINRLNDIKTKGYCVPITIHLAPTTYCNCKCYYCYVQDYNKKKVHLDKKVLFDFLEQAASRGVKAVEITGGGEPTVYPYFDELIEHCHLLGLDIGLVTNGYHLNPDVLKYAKWLRVSIDTFDQNHYHAIRKTSIPDLSCIGELSGKYDIVMGASCVINQKNYTDIYSFVSHAKALGFNNVWLKGVENSLELVNIKKQIEIELDKVKDLEDSSFKIFIGELFRNLESTTKKFDRCCFQHVAMMVYADGSIYPCCSLQGQEDYKYANIYDNSFDEILAMKHELPTEQCPLNCFWSTKNEFMEYIMLDDPRHVNFM